ncbi:hypothetical protein Glove_374g60 [Diversispora epigaea]|uniref:Concanavalin A-like lectin/glucanase domain-containing protein n=1 Tax=Diversispora epigaea TaxID=1348612 RepID=A0A397H5I1_9GLOM|nr:hypothetical protein Glove_374g60 [Diversispora epigaea]
MESKMIFSGPLDFPVNKKVVQHYELPPVRNELSITLRLKIDSHNSVKYPTIFHKGVTNEIRNPALFLSPSTSAPIPVCSTNTNMNLCLTVGTGLETNKWYHIGYTLSEPNKRMDFYIDGSWAGSKSIEQVQTQIIMFNQDPLYIGYSFVNGDFKGKIGNFRYYNWCLSANEIAENFVDTCQ